MESFRLDPDSVAEFLRIWPALAVVAVLSGLAAYFGILHPVVRVSEVVSLGVFGGHVFQGVAAQRLRDQYPGARGIWLLSVGATALVVGGASHVIFPDARVPAFELSWCGVAFFTILAFALVNRNNKHVIR